MTTQVRTYSQLGRLGAHVVRRGFPIARALRWVAPLCWLAGCSGDAAPVAWQSGEVGANLIADSNRNQGPADVASHEIDILPGRYPNLLRANADSEISVAVLGSDVRAEAPRLSHVALSDALSSTVRVEALGPGRQRDVNGDGRRDLVFAFSRRQLEQSALLTAATTRLSLIALNADGPALIGSDRIFLEQTPVLRLPIPVGQAVGTEPLALVDATRSGPDGKARTLVVRVWYPALATAAQPAQYFLNPRESALEEDIPNRFDVVHASSVLGAPRSRVPRRHALAVLSTGFGLSLTFYSTIAEQLASEGYFVFGIEHPGGSGSVVLPDGTAFPFDESSSPTLAVVEEWARDIVAVARAATDPDSAIGDFAERIDATQIAVLGHSLGGAAAVIAASNLTSIRAAINLDGKFWGDVLDSGPEQPVLFMSYDGHTAIDDTVPQFFAHARGPVYAVEVAGSQHGNFSDYTFWYPFAVLADPTLTPADFGLGVIAAPRMHEILSTYLSAFLAETLRGERSPLLHGTWKPFPEAPALTMH